MEVKKILMVFSTVLVTLITAMLLNFGAKSSSVFSLVGFSILGIVFLVNIVKFKIWGFVYKRYNLNESYPLTALFFPLIYLVAIINNEAVIEFNKIIGILLIVVGALVMSQREVN